ncbi:hypothetical protein PVK06_040101 [Gossypium arboreum]|uniref:Uncharacterized protein n=1 Tax=Gossypium arboreum TaxID=29729 RepID=A0ABR0N4M8_GOSAR|nr:hypothetical protein PVK06_040101 [Gossypium arboreum]
MTTEQWGLFFEIVELTYLEFTLELYSTETRKHRHRHHPRRLFLMEHGERDVLDLAYFIALAIRHLTERHRRGVSSIRPYVTRLARHFGISNTAAQSSSLTLIGQMSPQGISSMLSMRMIEKRCDTYPPQYRLV